MNELNINQSSNHSIKRMKKLESLIEQRKQNDQIRFYEIADEYKEGVKEIKIFRPSFRYSLDLFEKFTLIGEAISFLGIIFGIYLDEHHLFVPSFLCAIVFSIISFVISFNKKFSLLLEIQLNDLSSRRYCLYPKDHPVEIFIRNRIMTPEKFEKLLIKKLNKFEKKLLKQATPDEIIESYEE